MVVFGSIVGRIGCHSRVALSLWAPYVSLPTFHPPLPPSFLYTIYPTFFSAVFARRNARVNPVEIFVCCIVETSNRYALEPIFIESGGDNLAATFSPELADITIYMIDVAMGSDIPRKRGPAMMKSDILLVNKTDLAPYVEVDLSLMESDLKVAREDRPYFLIQAKNSINIEQVSQEIVELAGL